MNASEFTYGIEIETIIKVKSATQHNLRYYGTNSILPADWDVKGDGSILCNEDIKRGMEFVSPILQGIDGFRQIREVCATLKKLEAKVNFSCGLHVHVGFKDQSAEALARLIHLFAHHESGFFASTGTKTREKGYDGSVFAGSIKRSGREDAMKRMAQKKIEGREFTRNADRYQSLNLCNLFNERKTVEFRVFAGTTQFVKMALAVQMAIGLVQEAVNGEKLATWDAKPIEMQGKGYIALRRLLRRLRWDGEGEAAGIIDPTTKDSCFKEAIRLARKYDARG